MTASATACPATRSTYQERYARFPLDQKNGCLSMPIFDDRFHSPIALSLASIRNRRPLVNAQAALELSTPNAASAALFADLLAA